MLCHGLDYFCWFIYSSDTEVCAFIDTEQHRPISHCKGCSHSVKVSSGLGRFCTVMCTVVSVLVPGDNLVFLPVFLLLQACSAKVNIPVCE